MPVGDPLHTFDQKLGGNGIDEIGEQDDQGTPLEPGVEFGETQREIGLLVVIVELGGSALQARRSSTRRPVPVP